MANQRESVVILMADDDPDDRMMTQEAWEEARLSNDFRVVEDGEELMEYLRHQGRYADPATSPRPGLILLDLNMPRLDGRKALEQIRQDPDLRDIPVIVLTTSKAEEDIMRSYKVGANSYITKPVTFAGLAAAVQVMGKYWLEIVDLPDG